MKLAIGKAWSDAMADVQRRLPDFLLPASAFVFLPTLLFSRLAKAFTQSDAAVQGAQFAAGLFGIIAQAAIIAMILFPAADAGAAIRRGIAAAPQIILVTLALFLLFAPILLIASARGEQPAGPESLLVLAASIAIAYVALRLSVFTAAIVVEGLGAVAAVKRSWALTQGHALRIFAAVGALFILFIIASAILGAIGMILTGGTPQAPSFLTELLLAAATAIFSMFLAAVTAHIYRQLAAR